MPLDWWQPAERVGSDAVGDWFVARREALYRDAPTRALVWRMRDPGPKPPDSDFFQLFLDEKGWLGERLGGWLFQRLLDHGTDPVPFFVLEHIEGVPVRRLIERGHAMPTAEAIAVGVTLCDGAQEAQDLRAPDGADLGVCGLRLSADTVWLTERGVRVGNPELPQDVFAATQRGVPGVDKLDFLAPEQIRGAPGRYPETDVFSIGLVVLALVLGRSPFQRAEALETLRAIESVELDPAQLEPLRPALRDVLLRALDREPKRRPFHPAQLGAQLRAAGRSGGGPPPAGLLEGFSPEVCGITSTV